MKKYGYIYKTTHLRTGRYYIGQHKGAYNSDYLGSGRIIKDMLKKYDKSEFSLEVLAWAYSLKQLNELEDQYIGELYQTDPNCMNLIAGGKQSGYSDETLKKISETSKGRMIGRKWYHKGNKQVISYTKPEGYEEGRSEECKLVWKGINKGKPSWNKGIPMKEETKKKLSESTKGKVLTDETKNKIGKATKRLWEDPKYLKKMKNRRHLAGNKNPSFGKHWFNDGKGKIMLAFECPEGWFKGKSRKAGI